ncbi:unnamed protein product, partial [Polarella glacialis]
MAFSRGTRAGLGRMRPRGTLLLSGSLLGVVALSCLHLLGTDFVAGFPLSPTVRRSLHRVRAFQTFESSSQTSEGTDEEETRILVGGFDVDTPEANIRAHFAQAGSIVEFQTKGKGRARLTYSSPAEAQKAVDSLSGTTIAGNTRFLSVKLFESLAKERAIFVGGFASSTTEAALREYFGTAGSIVDFKFLSNYSALVTYSSNKEGKSAVASLHGKPMTRNRWLDVRVEGTPKVAIAKVVDEEVNKPQKAKKQTKKEAALNEGPEAAPPKGNTVSIIGWNKGTSEAAFREHCGNAGSIVDFQLN